MRTDHRKVTIWASLGSAIEYYDFVIYALMVKYLGKIFFPPQSDLSAILQTYLVFSVGYFARPFGGIILGFIGDVWGRKSAFLILTSIMALSTFSIGVLPSFEDIGVYASILLVICRIIQGISFGGELPGASIIIGEFSPFKYQGRDISFVISSTSLGAFSASLMLYIISLLLNEDQIVLWGWRIPFLAGGALGFISLIGRGYLQETPVFNSSSHYNSLWKIGYNLIKSYSRQMLGCIGLSIFFAALVVANMYYPFFMNNSFGYEMSSTYFGSTMGLMFSAAILPFMGMLADKFRKESIVSNVLLLYLLWGAALVPVLSIGTNSALIFSYLMHQLFIAAFVPAYFGIILTLFPPEIRFTGIAFCYNITFAFMSLLPGLLTSLQKDFNTPYVVPVVLSTITLISFASLKWLNKLSEETITA